MRCSARLLDVPPSVQNALRLSVRVHWGDQDAFGHLNNVLYLRYFESARIAYCEDSGWLSESSDIKPILAETQIKFRKQVRYPATLTLHTCTLQLREKVATMATLFMNGDDVVAEARAVCLAFDYKAQKTVAIPKKVVDYFNHIDAFQDPAIKKRLAETFQ